MFPKACSLFLFASAIAAQAPIHFEPNVGQAAPQVRFLWRDAGRALALLDDEAVLALHGPEAHATLRLSWAGAASAPEGRRATAARSHYLVGDDPEGWLTDVTRYAEVRYPSIRPGIDLVFHGAREALEYDFVVAPGADPASIVLAVEGAEPELDVAGRLVLATPAGNVVQQAPVAFQVADGERCAVRAAYRIDGARVSFELGAYDAARELVIDPVLDFSTFLGSSAQEDGYGIALDGLGHAYVTGRTWSVDFPVVNPLQGPTGSWDAFVTKLDVSSGTIVYSTYLGGSGADYGVDVVVDGHGMAWIAGMTRSANFPTWSAAQPALSGSEDAFVCRLVPAGDRFAFSTFLGGSSVDDARAIALANGGQGAYVVGATLSTNFPVWNAFQPTSGGWYDGFVTLVEPSGDWFPFSSYLGAASNDELNGVAVDDSGKVWVTGVTLSPTFPTVNAFQPTIGGWRDAVVVGLDPSPAGPFLASFLGGSDTDIGRGIAVDRDYVYVTGDTLSANFPLVDELQPYRGNYDAFVCAVERLTGAVHLSSPLGGYDSEAGADVAADGNGSFYVTGVTRSPKYFPLVDPIQPDLGGGSGDDAFAARLKVGHTLAWSTYLGGTDREVGFSIAADAAGNVAVAGTTHSDDFPVQNPIGSYQPVTDAFVTVIVP